MFVFIVSLDLDLIKGFNKVLVILWWVYLGLINNILI